MVFWVVLPVEGLLVVEGAVVVVEGLVLVEGTVMVVVLVVVVPNGLVAALVKWARRGEMAKDRTKGRLRPAQAVVAWRGLGRGQRCASEAGVAERASGWAWRESRRWGWVLERFWGFV